MGAAPPCSIRDTSCTSGTASRHPGRAFPRSRFCSRGGGRPWALGAGPPETDAHGAWRGRRGRPPGVPRSGPAVAGADPVGWNSWAPPLQPVDGDQVVAPEEVRTPDPEVRFEGAGEFPVARRLLPDPLVADPDRAGGVDREDELHPS